MAPTDPALAACQVAALRALHTPPNSPGSKVLLYLPLSQARKQARRKARSEAAPLPQWRCYCSWRLVCHGCFWKCFRSHPLAWSGEVGAGAKVGGGRGGGMRPCLPPLAEDPAPHCESAPARRKKTCSAFFPVHRKTFDPGLSDSFLPPSIPRAPALGPCPPLPAAPLAPLAAPSNGEAADKGAFLQSGSPSSHKFSGPA